MEKREKIAFLTNMISPYRVGFFEHLNKALNNYLVLYPFTYRESNRGWPVNVPLNTDVVWSESVGWKDTLSKGNYAERHFNIGLLKDLILNKWRVIIIGGYDSPNALLGFVIAKLRRIPVILWSGSTLESEISKKSYLKTMIKKNVFKYANCVVAYGTKSLQMAEHYGAQNVFCAFNSVDNEYYRKTLSCIEESPSNRPSGAVRFLFVGQLIERKGILELIEAYKQLRATCENTSLHIIGDGPLKERIAAKIDVIRDVSYLGSLYGEDLIMRYADSDVVCMPSKREVWGLVVNEAMLAGKAVIATKTSGAVVDLVQDGNTGFVIGQDHLIENLYRAMKEYAEKPQLAQVHGNKGNRIIQDITQQNAAKTFEKAILQLGV